MESRAEKARAVGDAGPAGALGFGSAEWAGCGNGGGAIVRY